LMSSWYHSKDTRARSTVAADFTPEVYTKIISSFCIQKDFAGCLVALHGIAQMFKVHPDPEMARVVLIAVSNMAEMAPVTLRGRRGRQQLPASVTRLKATSKVMADLAQRRAEVAAKNGIDITTLDVEARKEESLNLLSEFVRLVMVKQFGCADKAEAAVGQAAIACQLPDIGTGDKDCSNVVAMLHLDSHLRKEE
jgi:hypothetical protein